MRYKDEDELCTKTYERLRLLEEEGIPIFQAECPDKDFSAVLSLIQTAQLACLDGDLDKAFACNKEAIERCLSLEVPGFSELAWVVDLELSTLVNSNSLN